MKYPAVTEEALAALIPAFYARVRQDALIGPVFNRAVGDWPAHLQKLQAFWSSIMLTSGRYKGNPLQAHVRHADSISPRSFERWLELWSETVREMIEPAAAAALEDKARRIAESLQLGIAFHRDRDSLAAPCRASA